MQKRDTTRRVVEWLKSAPCSDCKRSFPPCAMDYDHRPGTDKRSTVANMVNAAESLDRIMDEIEKCDLVCACCHRVRTYSRFKSRGRINRNAR